jgi:uncharacterized membrane protein
MKNTFLFTLGLVLATFMISQVIVSGQVVISNIDLQVTPDTVSMCPDVSIVPVDGEDPSTEYFHTVDITVRNLGADPIIPRFELLNVPNGWVGEIQNYLDVSLAPGETGRVTLLLITPSNPAVTPGTYTVTIRADDLNGDSVEKDLNIEILPCYGIDISISDSYQESCTGTERSVVYPVTVTNIGRSTDVFKITEDVTWASLSESSVLLNPGESEIVELILQPGADMSGIQSLLVTAESQSYPSIHDSDEASLRLLDCFSFNATLLPTEEDVCIGKSVRYTLTIFNTGLDVDTYSVFAPDWVIVSETSITIQAGHSKEVAVTATPVQEGVMPVEVTVAPLSNTNNPMVVSSIVETSECRGVDVSITPSTVNVCQSTDAEIIARIDNTGTITGEYALSSSMGTLDVNTVTLSPGWAREVVLTLDTTDMTEGEHTVSITASQNSISDTEEVTVIVENCYGAIIDIVPSERQGCVSDVIFYDIILMNTGQLADIYMVTLNSDVYSHESQVHLEPDENKTIPIEIDTTGIDAGEYELTALAESDLSSVTANALLSVKKFDVCYSVLMAIEEESILTESCAGKAIPITVNNTGERAGTFEITYEGPEWIYMNIESIELAGGEEEIIYLYISPTCNISEGKFPVVVSAASEHTQTTIGIEIEMVPAGELGNVTTGDDTGTGSDIILNVSTGGGANITGLLTGDEDDSPLWKSYVIAAITIIIIIILVFRFVLLVRK